MAQAVRDAAPAILAANAEDVAEVRKAGQTDAFIDRLKLDPKRVAAIADGIDTVAALADPVGAVMASWERPNGMRIERVRVPLGVIGVIYESRPNVTADAGALALKAGNAVDPARRVGQFSLLARDLRGIAQGLSDAGLPETAIQLVPTRDRDAVGMMLAGLDGAIDVIVPRGGKSLVARVQTEARAAGVRPSRRQLPCLCGQGRRSRHGEGHRAQFQDAAHRRVRRRRDAAGRSRRRPGACSCRWCAC